MHAWCRTMPPGGRWHLLSRPDLISFNTIWFQSGKERRRPAVHDVVPNRVRLAAGGWPTTHWRGRFQGSGPACRSSSRCKCCCCADLEGCPSACMWTLASALDCMRSELCRRARSLRGTCCTVCSVQTRLKHLTPPARFMLLTTDLPCMQVAARQHAA
jgi:hypothetical protein